MPSESISSIIDEICDNFELALRNGEVPEISAALQCVSEEVRDALLVQLVKLTYEHQRKNGKQVSEKDYVGRFPDYLEAIRTAFQDIKDRSVSLANSPQQRAPDLSTFLIDSLMSETECDQVLELPAQVGSYRLTKLIGTGGFSNVYLASDDGGPQFAMKILKDRLPDDTQIREMFQSEAQTLREIRHPAIVDLIDEFVDESGRPCLVTELMAGGSLSEQLPVRWSPRRTARFIAILATALYRMHVNGFTHRDIKPANILLDQNGNPKLADVGLALADAARGKGKRGSVAGSLAYLSPEQARGDSHVVDGRTDVYSLGVVLYEMLTGRRPFQADDTTEQLRQIQQVALPPIRNVNPAIPHELERICMKATHKDAAQRYGTAADFARDLNKFAAAPAIKAASLVIVGAAFAIVIFFGWQYFGNDQQPDQRNSLVGPADTSPIAYEQANFSVRVSRDGKHEYQPLEDFSSLLPNDHVHFSVSLDEPAYVKLLWIDAVGRVQELYPNDPSIGNRGNGPVRTFESPESLSGGWPLEPVGTTDLALLFVRSTPFINFQPPALSPEEFPSGSAGVTHHLIDRTGEVSRIELLSATQDNLLRTRGLGLAKEANSPLYSLLEKLRQQADIVHAVQIPTAVEKPADDPVSGNVLE